MKTRSYINRSLVTFVTGIAIILCAGPAKAGLAVNLGDAGNFAALALTHGFDDSGPIGPNARYTIKGDVGVASTGQTFSASGSVVYTGDVYLHTGDTYNSSAPGVPPPEEQNAENDAYLEQARTDAFNASDFALTLGVTGTYGTISDTTTISETTVGSYVFDIQGINFSGGKTLTLSAPRGSSFVLNVSDELVLTFGSILVSGGLDPGSVLVNYTGTSSVRFSGGGNASQVYGTILAPNAAVQLSPGLVRGSVIADSISMSSGAQICPKRSRY